MNNLTDIKIKWEGYDDTNKDGDVAVQIEKSLIGFGKPLPESQPEAAADPPVKTFRQAPCDAMVNSFNLSSIPNKLKRIFK